MKITSPNSLQQKESKLNKARSLLLLIPISFLTGCTIFSNGMYGTYLPSPANGYRGLIAGELTTPTIDDMVPMCQSYGGLDISSIREEPTDWKMTGYYFRSYRCNGPSINAKPNREVIQPPAINTPPLRNSISFEGAKSKCIDLGFKENTESFGKCVLQLTK